MERDEQMKVNTANLPTEIQQRGLFNLWKYENSNGRQTKIPYNPNRPQSRGQSNERTTFAPMEIAIAAAAGFDGIGIGIFDDIAAIDIDHCIDDAGQLSPMARDIMQIMDSYTEISPSGKGLRILFAAPGFGYDRDTYYINNQKIGLEIYLPGMTNKYVTVTGNTLQSRPFVDKTSQLQIVLDRYMKRNTAEQQPREQQTLDSWQYVREQQSAAAALTDDEIINKAIRSANGSLFQALFNGDISGYQSHSEADLGFCNLLAFWTNKNAAQMERIFRQSGLNRENGGKYKSPAHYTTYLQNTIRKAIDGCKDVYTSQSTAARAAAAFSQPLEYDSIIKDESPRDQTETRAATAPEPPTDYTDFFLQANKQLTATDYHRGISLDTLNRFKVGFVETWRHPKAPPTVPTSPRLIIPTSSGSYLARDTRPADQIPEQSKSYIKSKVGATHLFNPKALEADEGAIFVEEGEINAMSIEDIGGHAVGLGSMNNGNLLLQAVKEHKPTQTLVIALDSESDPMKAEKVKAAAHKLTAELKQVGVKAVAISDLWGRYKDPNEMLQGDRSQLQSIIHQVSKDPENWEKTQYLNTFADHRTADYFAWIFNQADKPYTPTGFKELDRILNGGLYNEKLYAVGAISSLGKTTLVMQIADNIARSGRDVLIFSLEMSEFELYGKSISRLTYEITQREGGDSRNAKTELGISLNERWIAYSDAEKALIMQASQEHAEIGRHKKVLSGIGGYTVDSVRTATEKHISFTGKAPVVIVDYVQILESTDPRLSDKQKTDHDITALKRLAVQYKTPVLVISSLNRQNYKLPISYEAFKESGAIEYSVDVLIGLQLHGVGDPDFNVDKAKQADPREIELVLLKQRQGKTGLKIGFDYYPMFNYFTETGIIENDNYKDTDEDQSGGNSSTRYSDRPKVDKQAFKAQWNLIAAQQLEGGFADEWRLEREQRLLSKLDRTSDLYISYRKKYDKGLKKAERAKAEQMKLQPYNPPEYDSKSGKEIYHGKGTAEKSGVEYVKDMDYIIDEG